MPSSLRVLGQPHRLGRRVLVQILFFSSVLALLGTAAQLFIDFQRDTRAIEVRLEQIGSSYVGGLESSLWAFDSAQVATQLEGILKLPDIRSLDLVTPTGERYLVGSPAQGRGLRQRTFVLRHGTEDLGTLRVTASLDGVLKRLWGRALVILLTQVLWVLFVSIFILLVIHHLVTQHLGTMAAYTRRMDLGNLDLPLQLRRPAAKEGHQDELDEVVRSINDMRVSLRAGLEARNQAEAEIRALNLALEKRVEDRTNELRASNESLLVAMKAAEESNQAKSRFLTSMSHELRTPLNAILLYSELLEGDEKLASDPEVLADLGHIRTAGKFLLTLINNILDIAKIEAGKMSVYRQTVRISDLVAEIMASIRPLAEKNGNVLEQMVDPAVGTLETDVTKLRQIILNFLSNACKFTTKGVITLGVQLEPGSSRSPWLRLWVRDTGIGLSEEQLARLFVEFQQAEISTAREYGGTGLGLAISQNFSQLLGGEILVESEPGVGSTFILRLPMVQPVAAV